MKKEYIIAIVVVVVLVVGGLVYWHSSMQAPANVPSTTPPTEPPTTTPPAPPPAPPAPTSTPTPPAPQSFKVDGNDTTADVETITVAAGTPVTITFGADAVGTYHGGLDFRSSVVSTGPIAPGNTKTVSFVATSSFVFTPYWPSTNIKKPYVISVVVQ